MRVLALLLLLLLGGAADPPPESPAILIFSGTTGYRHDSIPAGIAALRKLGAERGLRVDSTEDPSAFSNANLKRYRAIVLLSSTTDPNDAKSEWLVGGRRQALQEFVRSGGGVLAVHAAADSHYHWPWYARLIGGRFVRHPEGTPSGRVTIVTPSHSSAKGLGRSIERADEWYYFDDYDPVSNVLMVLDPASIGEPDVNPNPVAWTRQIDAGRIFYTAMGHTIESYSDPWFLRHLGNGLDWLLAGAR